MLNNSHPSETANKARCCFQRGGGGGGGTKPSGHYIILTKYEAVQPMTVL